MTESESGVLPLHYTSISTFSIPQNVLYYIWIAEKSQVFYKNIFFIFAGYAFSALFDNLWHYLFHFKPAVISIS